MRRIDELDGMGGNLGKRLGAGLCAHLKGKRFGYFCSQQLKQLDPALIERSGGDSTFFLLDLICCKTYIVSSLV